MDLNGFWEIIRRSKDPEPGVRYILGQLTPSELIEFEHHFLKMLDDAYHWDLWGAAYVGCGGCSDDGFADFCAGLIFQGKDVYESALKNPDSLADLNQSLEELCMEELLYVATKVYRAKTKGEMPEHNIKFRKTPYGVKRDRQDLERLYPRLWQKYGPVS
jgi:hypothetical protein